MPIAINEKCIPGQLDFAFQHGITISQALLQVNYNVCRGLQHTTVLHLEKAYDEVNRETLLTAANQCGHTDLLNMVRSMLGPLHKKTSNNQTNYSALITRRFPQGAPSSPVRFNVYIDDLDTRGEGMKSMRRGDSAIVILADYILLLAIKGLGSGHENVGAESNIRGWN